MPAWLGLLVSCFFGSSSGFLHQTRRVSQDYCNMETFNATCREDEVIVVEGGRYGRMSVGRCMHGVYGSQGCSADVFRFLDNRCSGRQVCRFQVPDPEMYDMKPCPVDFTSYLEATYTCVQVFAGEKPTCDPGVALKVFNSTGYLSTIVAEERGYGGPRCPWVVEALPGQRINLTLFNFGTLSSGAGGSSERHGGYGPVSYGHQRPDVCFGVAEVTDGPEGKRPVTVCGGDAREASVYWTKSHVVQVEFPNAKLLHAIGAFVVRFKVTGCPDLKLPIEGWHQKSGEVLTVGCNTTGQVWHLVCKGTRWVGDFGNCSLSSTGGDSWSLEQMFSADDTFPFGVLVAVSLGVAMGVIIGGTLLCAITMYMKRQRRSSHAYSRPQEQHVCAASLFQHRHHLSSANWLTDTETVALQVPDVQPAAYRVTLPRGSLGVPGDNDAAPTPTPTGADYGGCDGGGARPTACIISHCGSVPAGNNGGSGFKQIPYFYESPCL